MSDYLDKDIFVKNPGVADGEAVSEIPVTGEAGIPGVKEPVTPVMEELEIPVTEEPEIPEIKEPEMPIVEEPKIPELVYHETGWSPNWNEPEKQGEEPVDGELNFTEAQKHPEPVEQPVRWEATQKYPGQMNGGQNSAETDAQPAPTIQSQESGVTPRNPRYSSQKSHRYQQDTTSGSGFYDRYPQPDQNRYSGPNPESGRDTSKNSRYEEPGKYPKKKSHVGIIALVLVLVLLVGGVVGGSIWSIYQYTTGKVEQGYASTEESEDFVQNETSPALEEMEAAPQSSQIQQATIPSGNTTQATGGVYVTDVSAVVEQALPSVVAITNTIVYENYYQNYWNYFGYFGQGDDNSYEVTGSGSGIILGDNGTELWIVSNNHVVEDASSLTVTFSDGSTAEAYIKGTDAENDLAMVGVKLENLSAETKAAIRTIELGDSDTLKMGEGVIAIGNALGFGQSVTTGCISALDREIQMSDGTTMTLLQTDAAINPGNSGGALLDRDGKLIGINVSKYSDTDVEGMGFAIPISKAKGILDELSLQEPEAPRTPVSEAEYPYLGVQLKDISSMMVSGYGMPAGIMVYYVEENGPAAKAGIQTNDIITKFAGKEIANYEELSEELQYHAGGTTVTMTVMRIEQGRYVEKELPVTLGFRAEHQN